MSWCPIGHRRPAERCRMCGWRWAGQSGSCSPQYFIDPDGQELTYRVEFSDPSVATGPVSGDTLIATAGDAGTTAGTATATDPGGLSVSQDFTVSVVSPERLLRGRFRIGRIGLANWTVADSSAASIADGRLWLENIASGYLGFADTTLAATEWEVTMALGNATSDAWAAALIVGADHERFSSYQIQIGADNNAFQLGNTDYRFFLFDTSGPFWGL